MKSAWMRPVCPSSASFRESSGVIAVYVEDQVEQAALTVLRQAVFKVDQL
jgi:hypothetical protein